MMQLYSQIGTMGVKDTTCVLGNEKFNSPIQVIGRVYREFG